MDSDTGSKMWVVVHIWRGIPVLVEGFYAERVAHRRARQLRRDINPDEEDVAVFEVIPQ